MSARAARFLCTLHGLQLCAAGDCLATHCSAHDECWLLNLPAQQLPATKRDQAPPGDHDDHCDVSLRTETTHNHTAACEHKNAENERPVTSGGSQGDNKILVTKETDPVKCQLCEQRLRDIITAGERRRKETSSNLACFLDASDLFSDDGLEVSNDNFDTSAHANDSYSIDSGLAKDYTSEVGTDIGSSNNHEHSEQSSEKPTVLTGENKSCGRKYNFRPRQNKVTSYASNYSVSSGIQVVHGNRSHDNLTSLLKRPIAGIGADVDDCSDTAQKQVRFCEFDYCQTILASGVRVTDASVQTEPRVAVEDVTSLTCVRDVTDLLLELQAKAASLERRVTSHKRRMSDNTKACIVQYVQLMHTSISLVQDVLQSHESPPAGGEAEGSYEPLVLVKKNLHCLLRLELATAESLGSLDTGQASDQFRQDSMSERMFWFFCGLLAPFLAYMYVFL